MRLQNPGCVLLIAVLVCGGHDAFAQPVPRGAAYTARMRSPAGLLTSPGYAALTSNVVGIAGHLHMGIDSEDPFTGVYGASLDLPVLGNVASGQVRVGGALAAIQGPCSSDVLDNQDSCFVGTGVGGNVMASLPVGLGTAPGPQFTVGWSADAAATSIKRPSTLGLPDYVKERSISVGFGVPLMLSFRAGRRASSSEKDPRFNPRTTVFVEPAISFGSIHADEKKSGSMTQITVGASILQIGPGFGITAVARKLVLGNHPMFGAAAISFHGRRRA